MKTEPAACLGRSLLARLGFFALGCWVACGCGPSALRPAASPDELFTDRIPMVRPGSLDAENRYQSTVQVCSWEMARKSDKKPPTCSGTVIAPRLILTAGHCVCKRRDATPEDLAKAPESAKDRAHAINGRTVTAVIAASDCARQATVETFIYDSSEGGDGPKKPTQHYEGAVRAHPDLELLFEQKTAIWVNADLAVIFLTEELKGITPVRLADAEVQEGDGITLVGYGKAETKEPAKRRVGESQVFRIRSGVEFVAKAQRLENGMSASYLEGGDSGGGCFKADDPTVLVGINAATKENIWGEMLSFFTSVYAFRDWLEQQIKEARARQDLP